MSIPASPGKSDDDTLALRVTRAEPAADGIQLFELRNPDGTALPAFTPGAHLAVRIPSGAMRTYSLCNDASDRSRYLIAVKRDSAGRGGSIALVDTVHEGDTIEVSRPRNLFELAADAPGYIFVAGGIGITPILSMIHWIEAQRPVPFQLYYLTRTPAAAAFREELAAMGAHIVIHHDEGSPENAYDLWPAFEQPSKAHIYCCGPRPLMDSVRDMTGHWPVSQVHFEDFGSDLVRPRDDDEVFSIRLARRGDTLSIPIGTTLLEVLRTHGVDCPSSCESGTCGTCRMGLLGGDADHRDMVLTAAERTSSIMPCVSRGRGELVLDL